METLKCPHCGKSFNVALAIMKNGSGSDRPHPKPNAEVPGDIANILAFMHKLDDAHFEVTDFEADFLASVFEREGKYFGNVRFTSKQLEVVKKMTEKYGEQLDEAQVALEHGAHPAPEAKPKGDDIPF